MRYFILFVTLLISCNATVNKESTTLNATFLPKELENNYHNYDYQVGGIDEDTFNSIIDMADEVYTPILRKNGLNLKFDRMWENDTVNAYCQRESNLVTVTMMGGLARANEMTPEGFVLVVCHEIFHGLSLYPLYPSSWASSEGSSDYGAVASCARKLFSGINSDRCNCNFAPEYSRVIDRSCSKFSDEDRNIICKRSMAGGLSLGKVLASLGGEPIPSYENPSKVVVSKTQTSHPSASCRLTQYGIAALTDYEIPEAPLLSTKSKARSLLSEYSPCWFRD